MISSNEVWNAEAAARYDTPGQGMFSAETLCPTLTRLQELASGGRVLEFAVGTGRVAIPLVELGCSVVGIELSPHMIARLREKADAATLPVIEGDMTTARAEGDFSLVVLVYNTIANLLTQEAQVECFRNAARHLPVGGRFVIELWVPQLRSLPPGAPGTVNAVTDSYIGLDTFKPATQHCVSHHFTFGAGTEARLARSYHRYIWPAELDLMGQLTGFSLESRHSDWAGAPFTDESTSHVSVYRRDG